MAVTAGTGLDSLVYDKNDDASRVLTVACCST
jgi:hypothetical protein